MPPPRGSIQIDRGGSGSGVFGALRAPATIQDVQIQGCSLQGNPSFFRRRADCPRIVRVHKKTEFARIRQSSLSGEHYRLLAGRSNERITNRQLSINCLAVVKIFGIERRASSFQRGGNDQRAIDVVSVLLRNLECRVMHFNGDWEREGQRTRKAFNASVTSLQDIRIFRRATEANSFRICTLSTPPDARSSSACVLRGSSCATA